MTELKIIDINKTTIETNPPRCFLNQKHPGYITKRSWLEQRFSEGLTIKHLIIKENKKTIGFIEYIPGENAWRAVTANNYLFIHCLWISPNAYKNQGHGSLLINHVIHDAKKQNKNGVAVVTSEGPFMTGKAIFEKNGFTSIASAKPSYELMINSLKNGPVPTFNNWEQQLQKCQDLQIIYAPQCPWVVRSIQEISEYVKKHNIIINFTELKTANEAQNAPSPYSVFNLIYNGKLLVDHYISIRRFETVLKKEVP